MLVSFPLVQYLIPVESISDDQWDMFTAVDQFYYDTDAELEEKFNAHDQKRILAAFCSENSRETIGGVLCSKEFKQYKLPIGAVALLNDVTAIIQTGVIE
jgi:hypothetical protein